MKLCEAGLCLWGPGAQCMSAVGLCLDECGAGAGPCGNNDGVAESCTVTAGRCLGVHSVSMDGTCLWSHVQAPGVNSNSAPDLGRLLTLSLSCEMGRTTVLPQLAAGD